MTVLPAASPLVSASRSTPSDGGLRARSAARRTLVADRSSRPATQVITRSAEYRVSSGRSKRAGSMASGARLPSRSRNLARSVNDSGMDSAEMRSTASIIALTRADVASRPFPRCVVRSRASGVTAAKTGSRSLSSGESSETRVIGIRAATALTRRSACSAVVTRSTRGSTLGLGGKHQGSLICKAVLDSWRSSGDRGAIHRRRYPDRLRDLRCCRTYEAARPVEDILELRV